VIEVASHNDVIQGELGLVYLMPEWGSIVGGARGVDVDDG